MNLNPIIPFMMRAFRQGLASLCLGCLGLLSGAAELQRFELVSEYLKAPVTVEVLVPDGTHATSRLPVVYVLAAEPRTDGNRGLAEIQRLGLADKHRVICVGVNFDSMPWYGDHATDPGIRHESHILHRLIPEIDRRYPTQAERDGRWLLGFSKSGWGACTLLFRNRETFGYAASWDAPLLFSAEDFGTYLTAPHFGTAENFAEYLPTELARSQANEFRDRARLVLAGSALFGGEPDKRFAATPHTETMHQLLGELAIPHRYDPELKFRHSWNSGWLEPTLAHLVDLAQADGKIAAPVNLSNTGALAHAQPGRTLDSPAMSVPTPALHYYQPIASARLPQQTEADVVIYGATSAGVVAAIQLAQLGRRVTLLEFGGHVGGVTASGLGATDIGNKRAIGGLARDFYRQLGKHYGKEESWTFEPKVAEATFTAWLAEAGVAVHFFQRLAGVTMADGAIRELRTESGDVWVGKIFIDTSYEGDLLAAAGVSYHVGREGNARYGEIHNGVAWGHPGHNFKLAVDPYVNPGEPGSGLLPGVFLGDGGKEGEGDSRVQAYNFRLCLTQAADRVPFPKPAGYDAHRYELLRRYIDAGMWDVLRLTTHMPNGKTDTNNFGAFSSDNIGMNHAWPEADYATREKIFQDHVTYHQGLMWFLANDPRLPARVREEVNAWGLPRDEFQETGHWPHQLYVREARRMVSDYVMTENDCVRARACNDPVGLAAYTMDSHACNRVVRGGRVYNEGLVEMGGFPPYGISYRSIVPRRGECRNLLVPVCLAASHIAYGSIRMEPVFMVLAQSAALAAHLALDTNVAVQDVPYATLRDKLLAAGQVLAWKHDPFAPPEAKNP